MHTAFFNVIYISYIISTENSKKLYKILSNREVLIILILYESTIMIFWKFHRDILNSIQDIRSHITMSSLMYA